MFSSAPAARTGFTWSLPRTPSITLPISRASTTSMSGMWAISAAGCTASTAGSPTTAAAGYHPLVNFLYFALVLVFGMCFMHPLCLLISVGSATAYSIYLKGRRGLRFSLRFLLPMMVLAAILNPAFNHEGATILAYLPSGNPLTLESMVYGVAAALMLASVVQWFSCYNEVMTSDKFVYLFGRVIPALSLVLSMTLRFVPRFKAQLDTVREAQASLGRDVSEGSALQRLKNAVTILSIMITWARLAMPSLRIT